MSCPSMDWLPLGWVLPQKSASCPVHLWIGCPWAEFYPRNPLHVLSIYGLAALGLSSTPEICFMSCPSMDWLPLGWVLPQKSKCLCSGELRHMKIRPAVLWLLGQDSGSQMIMAKTVLDTCSSPHPLISSCTYISFIQIVCQRYSLPNMISSHCSTINASLPLSVRQ